MLSFINLSGGDTLPNSCLSYITFSFCVCAHAGMSAIVCHSSSIRFRNQDWTEGIKWKKKKSGINSHVIAQKNLDLNEVKCEQSWIFH